MIENIKLMSVASYNDFGAEFKDLGKVNFIYGNNGNGKSTFSNYFLNSDVPKYSKCEMNGNLRNIGTFVYNQQFIENNFKDSDEIPGIFTLGKESLEVQEKISQLDKQIEKNKEKLEKNQELLTKTTGEITHKNNELKEIVWNVKSDKSSKWFSIYQNAFQGYHNNKNKFFERFLEISHDTFVGNEDELYEKAQQIYQNDIEIMELLDTYSEQLTIDLTIFEKVIVGKEDVPIAKLINELENSDWVRNGQAIIERHSLEVCPMCQQSIRNNLVSQLNSYFDTEYIHNMNVLDENIKKYITSIEKIKKDIETYIAKPFINLEEVGKVILEIESIHYKNIVIIQQKNSSPSTKVQIEIEGINNIINEFNNMVKLANNNIEENNRIAVNIKMERMTVQSDVWKYFALENAVIATKLIEENKSLVKMNLGISLGIKRLEDFVNSDEITRNELLKEVIGIEETVVNINTQLMSYGFNNFKLSSTEDRGKYTIIRPDGELANKTLSEGERTFITFLYFYHLVIGDLSSGPEEKIVVIDDPISSLDSTVLYIVATLVKELITKLEYEMHGIKQIILLTHNTYFYKEVTYKIRINEGFANYYVLRKIDAWSDVKKYDQNPISTSYEELWKELIELKNSSSSVIQNVMRRILENYFKFLGGINLDKLQEPFEEADKVIVKSLIMWIHDGSHFIPEDLYVQQNTEINSKYYRIFKEIFIKNNHESHFDMMINSCIPKDEHKIFTLVEVQTA